MLVDGMVDVSGGLVFTVLAGFLLGSADPTGAARAAGPAGRRRADDARPRRPDQGLPGRRPRGHGGRHRAGRRPDGGGDDGQGQQRHRHHARPACEGLVDHRRDDGGPRPRPRRGVMAFSQGSADVGLGLVLLVSAGALAVRRRSTSARWRCSSPTSAGSASCRGWSGGCWPAASRRRSPSTACASSSPAATRPTRCGRGRCRSSAASVASARRRPSGAGAAAAPRGARARGALPGWRRRPRHLVHDATAAASSC